MPKPYHYGPLIRKIEELLASGTQSGSLGRADAVRHPRSRSGHRFELTEPMIRLGRDASNALQLHDTEVSRHHAEIRRADNDYTISDLNSSNGTFVNGQRIRQHKLQSGDQIQIRRHADALHGPGRRDAGRPGQDHQHRPAGRPRRPLADRPLGEPGGRQPHLRLRGEARRRTRGWPGRGATCRSCIARPWRSATRLDIDQLLSRIMELIFEWVEADRGCIMMMDPAAKTLQPKVRRTRKGIRADERITISKTILDYVIERNEGVLTSDARQDDRWDAGRQHRADGRPRGDLRAHAGPLRRRRRDLHRHLDLGPAIDPAGRAPTSSPRTT